MRLKTEIVGMHSSNQHNGNENKDIATEICGGDLIFGPIAVDSDGIIRSTPIGSHKAHRLQTKNALSTIS